MVLLIRAERKKCKFASISDFHIIFRFFSVAASLFVVKCCFFLLKTVILELEQTNIYKHTKMLLIQFFNFKRASIQSTREKFFLEFSVLFFVSVKNLATKLLLCFCCCAQNDYYDDDDDDENRFDGFLWFNVTKMICCH